VIPVAAVFVVIVMVVDVVVVIVFLVIDMIVVVLVVVFVFVVLAREPLVFFLLSTVPQDRYPVHSNRGPPRCPHFQLQWAEVL